MAKWLRCHLRMSTPGKSQYNGALGYDEISSGLEAVEHWNNATENFQSHAKRILRHLTNLSTSTKNSLVRGGAKRRHILSFAVKYGDWSREQGCFTTSHQHVRHVSNTFHVVRTLVHVTKKRKLLHFKRTFAGQRIGAKQCKKSLSFCKLNYQRRSTYTTTMQRGSITI